MLCAMCERKFCENLAGWKSWPTLNLQHYRGPTGEKRCRQPILTKKTKKTNVERMDG